MKLESSRRNRSLTSIASFLISWLLSTQPFAVFAADSRAVDPSSGIAADQKAVQVLSRLTFGARPGDLDAVRQMGVQAYVDQQLSPDSIDDSALQKRLDKLPTLSLSNPSIAELYNPPKPTPTPMP
ncbi:MAG TPA: DUF1800 family protein, partial [Pyrinomonadaceae bacterium]|nr:DUF1800 family protein [Pyrinomonadaceae bacterium]